MRGCAQLFLKIGCLKLIGDEAPTSKCGYESVFYLGQLLLDVVDSDRRCGCFDIGAKKNRGPAQRI